MSSRDSLLAGAIRDRSRRMRLATTLATIRYFNELEYSGLGSPRRALYVGLGHGHDALAAILDNKVESIAGVDPYIGHHGNDDEDRRRLLKLAAYLGVGERLAVIKMSAQEYLTKHGPPFDAVFLNDVLHHIFETDEPLSRSICWEPAIAFFRSLEQRTDHAATMTLYDSVRHGLRPLLNNYGITRRDVDYTTKQDARYWIASAERAGWVHRWTRPYIPYKLRKASVVIGTFPFRFLTNDHYVIRFEKRPGSR